MFGTQGPEVRILSLRPENARSDPDTWVKTVLSAVANTIDAFEPLGMDMDQLAPTFALITNHRLPWVEGAQTAEP